MVNLAGNLADSDRLRPFERAWTKWPSANLVSVSDFGFAIVGTRLPNWPEIQESIVSQSLGGSSFKAE